MSTSTIKKAVILALYASLSVFTVSVAANANTTTINVTSSTTTALSQINVQTVINLNGYNYSSYAVATVSKRN